MANGELGTIAKIDDQQLTVALDSGRQVSFETEKFPHLDHGYAVTSHSSQGTTVDRVLVNANTRESELLLNDRMSYVAVSRAREDAIIYTNSTQDLSEALERRVDKEMALEAMKYSIDQRQNQREESTQDSILNREDSSLERTLEESAFDNYEKAQATPEVARSEEIEFELTL